MSLADRARRAWAEEKERRREVAGCLFREVWGQAPDRVSLDEEGWRTYFTADGMAFRVTGADRRPPTFGPQMGPLELGWEVRIGCKWRTVHGLISLGHLLEGGDGSVS